jgi:hypothetical protein
MNDYLNQDCDLAPDLESMLLAHVPEIFLQQYRHFCDVNDGRSGVRNWADCGSAALTLSATARK